MLIADVSLQRVFVDKGMTHRTRGLVYKENNVLERSRLVNLMLLSHVIF